MKVSEQIGSMIHAFPVTDSRRYAVRSLAARVARMENALRDFADNFDCDQDAHKYGTTCRACTSSEVLL